MDFIKSRRHSETGVKCPHFLVEWVGFDSSHDVWLPLDALSSCIDEVAHYRFHNAAPAQRGRIINMSPSDARMHLAQLVIRAQRKQARGKTPTPHTDSATATSASPCRKRTSPRLKQVENSPQQSATSVMATCTMCGSHLYFPPDCHRALV